MISIKLMVVVLIISSTLLGLVIWHFYWLYQIEKGKNKELSNNLKIMNQIIKDFKITTCSHCKKKNDDCNGGAMACDGYVSDVEVKNEEK